MSVSVASSLLPRLSKYEVLEEIGHGGMATVYRALDRRLGREVAVKVIHRHLRESAEVGRRFTAEARAVAKLRHPNIVEIFDVSEDDAPERYLVAELVRGKSLRRVLSEQERLPAEIAACVGVALANALSHAHERGVVHRDVKPENVLFGFLTENEAGKPAGTVEVKITDFGIAKMLDQQGVTATGQVLGSPAYMAPEQIECGDVDARSDVFALGVLLYESMVGHLPFEGKNPAQVLRRVLDGQFSPADREVPTVGARWAVIVAKMLAQKPEDRFPSMTAVETALADELAELGIENQQAELAKFFAKPAAYEASLPTRLVPRLFARGQAAHRTGDVVGAAAHLNRALAFAPGDAAILAHLSRLTQSESRRLLARRAGLALVAITTVVGAAYATSRFVAKGPDRSPGPAVSVDPPPVISAVAAESAAPRASSSGAPVVSGTPHTVAIPRIAAPLVPGPGTTGVQAPKERAVKFSIVPKSALIAIDGGPALDAFGLGPRVLAVGPHTIVVSVAPDNPCCEKRSFSLDVKPSDDGSDAPLVASYSLPFRPATLVSDGPASAVVRCAQLNVEMAAKGSYEVKMSKLEETGTCVLLDAGAEVARQTITLNAGKLRALSWPTGG